jgi:hypothetical protein
MVTMHQALDTTLGINSRSFAIALSLCLLFCPHLTVVLHPPKVENVIHQKCILCTNPTEHHYLATALSSLRSPLIIMRLLESYNITRVIYHIALTREKVQVQNSK